MEEFLKQIMTNFKPYHINKGMTYEDSVLLLAVAAYHKVTGDSHYLDFIRDYVDLHVDSEGYIQNYHLEEYNIDNILAGNVLYLLMDHTEDPRYEKAVRLLREQLRTHPRTRSGSFWHKLRYPYQIWLDGLYMGQPFYLNFGLRTNDTDIVSDVLRQVDNVRRYLWDPKRQLYCHAYDEKKVMQWANKETGLSPNVWSRSVGWFAMALVELYELLPSLLTKERNKLSGLLVELIEGMKPYQDPNSQMWYQIVDKPKLERNYLETSGSAMLAYSMLKGARLGMLDPTYRVAGELALSGIENTVLRLVDRHYVLGGTCKVAGLDNDLRDGSDEYYLSEPIVDNEIKGVGPFLFAQAEIKSLQSK